MGENNKKSTRLRRLFDRWIPEAVTMMGVLKILQFLRLLGVKATGNGWRKVTSIFLRNESSKFALGVFRVNPDSNALFPAPDRFTAESRLAAKLGAYLRLNPAINYWVEPGKLAFIRRRKRFHDLMLVKVDSMGAIAEIIPYFDSSGCEIDPANAVVIETLEAVKYYCNKLREQPEDRRAIRLSNAVRRWSRRKSRFYYFGRRRRRYIAQRILHATMLFCEIMKSCDSQDMLTRERVKMPDFRKYRNPGFGMLGVLARFTPDFREVDLWCQFNHVATDGQPMQEFLEKLRCDWQCCGRMEFPAGITDKNAAAQRHYIGDGNFRVLFFEDFRPLLAVRRYLNEHYTEEMNGSATVAGLLMWGLSRHAEFARCKILLPVDAGIHDGERQLGLMIIRPQMFTRNSGEPLKDFCKFQREMNERIKQSRNGIGAVSEFLELCALMHPLFYHLARRIWPRALDEVLGTAGLSILRSDIFLSPATEFQRGGFIAVGNLEVPTADGGTAGAVSIAGSRKQIVESWGAMRNLPRNLVNMLDLQGKVFWLQNDANAQNNTFYTEK